MGAFVPTLFPETREVVELPVVAMDDRNVRAAINRIQALADDPKRRHIHGSRVLSRPLVEAMRIAFHIGISVADLADMVDTRDATVARALAGESWRTASGPLADRKAVGL